MEIKEWQKILLNPHLLAKTSDSTHVYEYYPIRLHAANEFSESTKFLYRTFSDIFLITASIPFIIIHPI